MDLKQAIEEMKKGKKVRGDTWDSDSYIYTMDKINIINQDCNSLTMNMLILKQNFEIYEEEDNWNFKVNAGYTYNKMKDIEKLKEKILEDIRSIGYIEKPMNDNIVIENSVFEEDIKEILTARFGF